MSFWWRPLDVQSLDCFYHTQVGESFCQLHLFVVLCNRLVPVASIILEAQVGFQGSSDLGAAAAWGLAQAMIPALLMNIAIVGFNQLTDVDIDKVNKPYLPLASGELTMQQVRFSFQSGKWLWEWNPPIKRADSEWTVEFVQSLLCLSLTACAPRLLQLRFASDRRPILIIQPWMEARPHLSFMSAITFKFRLQSVCPYNMVPDPMYVTSHQPPDIIIV